MERFHSTIVSLALTLVFAGTLILGFATAVHAAENGEIHVTREGTVSIKNAVVFQVAGTNFYVRVYWKEVFIRVTVVTNSNTTKIIKRYGEKATPADFKEGDYLDIEGVFPSASESFIINATSIVNRSLQKEALTTSGTVLAVYPDRDEFTMRTYRGTAITVVATGAVMKKGIIAIGTLNMKAGDKITHVSGTYDFSTKTLTATRIDIWQDPGVFVPRNFEGKLKSIEGTTLPTSILVAVGSKEYTVRLNAATKLTNKAGAPIILSRFLVGDTVRFYGKVREDNLSIVENVELLKNLSL